MNSVDMDTLIVLGSAIGNLICVAIVAVCAYQEWRRFDDRR